MESMKEHIENADSFFLEKDGSSIDSSSVFDSDFALTCFILAGFYGTSFFASIVYRIKKKSAMMELNYHVFVDCIVFATGCLFCEPSVPSFFRHLTLCLFCFMSQ